MLATLVLDSLTCQVTDDLGSDEPIITIDEEEVWRASDVDEGDVRVIDVRRSFVDVAIVKLFDEEVGVNDELGSRVVQADEAGIGPRQAFFTQAADARYVLSYHVE
jgi:hypothetical protein